MKHDVAYSRHSIFWNYAENLLESRRFSVIEKKKTFIINIISNAYYSNAFNRRAMRGLEFSTTNRLPLDFIVALCLLAKMTVPTSAVGYRIYF